MKRSTFRLAHSYFTACFAATLVLGLVALPGCGADTSSTVIEQTAESEQAMDDYESAMEEFEEERR